VQGDVKVQSKVQIQIQHSKTLQTINVCIQPWARILFIRWLAVCHT